MFIRFLKLFILCLLSVIKVGENLPLDEKSTVQYSHNVDERDNATLPCPFMKYDLPATDSLIWLREGKKDSNISHSLVLPNGSLFLSDISVADTGVYKCISQEKKDIVLSIVYLNVRTTPALVKNFTIRPSTVLAAVDWEKPENGGHPVLSFTIRYRALHEDVWHLVLSGHINPSLSQVDVYRLEPNTTYVFQIWASNKLGPGKVNEQEITTLHNDEEIELARHLLVGVETFDTRIWLVAVALVLGTLVFLGFATCFVFYRECHKQSTDSDSEEIMELVPHIIMNPGYHEENADWSEPDDECHQITFHQNYSVQLTSKTKPTKM